MLADLLTFQVKLVVDGLRDLIMSPISLVAGILGLVTRPSNPGKYFYDALRWGKQTEQWIDLFGAIRHDVNDPARGLDEWIRKVESAVAEQYEKGGITRRAKEGFDEAVEKLHRRQNRDGPEAKPQ